MRGLLVALAAAAAAAPPNILLITSDQQRVDSVGAYGLSPPGVSYSPRLDALRAEGVLWTHAFAASPVCSPCRTSLLTGVHVPVHAVVENTVAPMRAGLSVYPDLLRRQGYVPYVFGKTHFSPVPASFAVVDAHSGNTDMRCSAKNYASGACDIAEADFLETYERVAARARARRG